MEKNKMEKDKYCKCVNRRPKQKIRKWGFLYCKKCERFIK